LWREQWFDSRALEPSRAFAEINELTDKASRGAIVKHITAEGILDQDVRPLGFLERISTILGSFSSKASGLVSPREK